MQRPTCCIVCSPTSPTKKTHTHTQTHTEYNCRTQRSSTLLASVRLVSILRARTQTSSQNAICNLHLGPHPMQHNPIRLITAQQQSAPLQRRTLPSNEPEGVSLSICVIFYENPAATPFPAGIAGHLWDIQNTKRGLIKYVASHQGHFEKSYLIPQPDFTIPRQRGVLLPPSSGHGGIQSNTQSAFPWVL